MDISINQINDKLALLFKRLDSIEDELVNARERMKLAKAEYENLYQKTIHLEKVHNPDLTQSDLKALATNVSYELQISYIKAESSYTKLKLERERLRDELEILKELSYNQRTVLKSGSYNP